MIKRLIRQRWFWEAVTLGAVVTLLTVFLKKLLTLPSRIVAVHKKSGEKLVILFGDSITQGEMSANFVEKLAYRMEREDYRFMNAGISVCASSTRTSKHWQTSWMSPTCRSMKLCNSTCERINKSRGRHLKNRVQRQ